MEVLWQGRRPPPIPADLAQRLARLPVATLGDAMGRMGVVDGAIRRVAGEGVLAGPAWTVESHPGDNGAIHLALERCRPGEVLVVSTGGELRCGVMGELMLRRAQAKGVAGVVVDGAVRDRAFLATFPLPVYARGIGALGALKASGGRQGTPVAVGGVAVCAGDFVVGDADGVAVVPRALAAQVAARAEAKVREEERVRQGLDGGVSLLALLGVGPQGDSR